jgi:histidinol-phosphate aminotransferase
LPQLVSIVGSRIAATTDSDRAPILFNVTPQGSQSMSKSRRKNKNKKTESSRGWKLGDFHLISPGMTSIWDLANPQLRDIKVYEPGKPIEETARELGIEPDAIIKLASNENPLGPSPKAVRAMRAALKNAHLYPDGSGFYLRKAVAAKVGVAPENVILGNGSNEVIEFLGHAFLNPGDEVITFQYAFIIYKLLATAFAARTIELPTPNFQQDLSAALDAITPKTRLIFIPNPNNPTGTLISQRAIDGFMSRVPKNIVVVFDEAYFEFLDDPPDTLQYVREGRNVVVLRTFSKIHGLAGLRIGYAVATADLIEILHKTRQPFNVNSIAQAGALAALEDHAHLRETKRVIDEGRAYLQEQFSAMQIPFVPTVANFVMVNAGDGCSVFEKLLRQKIIVRPLKGYGLPEWVRITVGTMEENKQLVAALSKLFGCAN